MTWNVGHRYTGTSPGPSDRHYAIDIRICQWIICRQRGGRGRHHPARKREKQRARYSPNASKRRLRRTVVAVAAGHRPATWSGSTAASPPSSAAFARSPRDLGRARRVASKSKPLTSLSLLSGCDQQSVRRLRGSAYSAGSCLSPRRLRGGLATRAQHRTLRLRGTRRQGLLHRRSSRIPTGGRQI
jgi:hypothetical protein